MRRPFTSASLLIMTITVPYSIISCIDFCHWLSWEYSYKVVILELFEINEQLSVSNSLNILCYQSNCMNWFFLQIWRLYVWELDIAWLSVTVVDVVNIPKKHRCFSSFVLSSALSQSNRRQSFAIKSDLNKRANACKEKLRQRNIKKATQYWQQTVDIGLWRI